MIVRTTSYMTNYPTQLSRLVHVGYLSIWYVCKCCKLYTFVKLFTTQLFCINREERVCICNAIMTHYSLYYLSSVSLFTLHTLHSLSLFSSLSLLYTLFNPKHFSIFMHTIYIVHIHMCAESFTSPIINVLFDLLELLFKFITTSIDMDWKMMMRKERFRWNEISWCIYRWNDDNIWDFIKNEIDDEPTDNKSEVIRKLSS